MSIIIAYFAIALSHGMLISKRAIKNMNSYFLGSNKLPWWMLGISDASGMYDITDTMWLVYALFVFKSIFLP